MTDRPDLVAAAHARADQRAVEAERILRALVHHGPLSFHHLSRKALPNVGLRPVDNIVRWLADRGYIQTTRTGRRVWSITEAGRARLHLAPFFASPAALPGAPSPEPPRPAA